MIKTPTDEVVSIHNFQIKPELIKSISSLIRKKQRLTDNDTRQVQGDGVEGVLPFLNVGKRLN